MPRELTVDEILDRTEVVDIDSIQQHPQNPRIGDEEKIKKSIHYHGQYRAIGVSEDNFILFGNHTWLGMKLDGKTRVLIHRLPFKHDDPQALKILLVDNRASDGSDYDLGILRIILEDVRLTEDELEGTLYDDDFLLKLLQEDEKAGQEDPDDIPALPPDPITQKGDVWVLGKHILVCGDATSTTPYEHLFRSANAEMIFTDPPYGISYLRDLEEAKAMNHRTDGKTIDTDELVEEDLADFLRDSLSLAVSHVRKGGAVYVCGPPGPTAITFGGVLQEMKILRQIIVWAKDQLVYGRSDYHYMHEFVFYGWEPNGSHHFTDDRTQNTLWQIDRPKRSDQHPTMKPVELVQRALMNSSKAGDVVIDPFAGSGTTLIAAQLTHRIARCIEIDPAYCDVVCQRFQEIAGILPVLASTMEPTDFVSRESKVAVAK